MSKRRSQLWAAGRVTLAMVLLVIVFRYIIPMRDTVELADGTLLTGAFIEQRADVVVMDTADGIITVAYSQMAYDAAGEPEVSRGFIPLLREMRAGRYLIGLAMLGMIPWIAAVRWCTLMRAQGMPLGYWRALELTYLGLFCNNFMPGLTGGDVAKAYYASKLTSTLKTNAVVTVFLDRLVGIVVLAMLAGAAVLVALVFARSENSADFLIAARIILIFVLCSLAGIAGFFSRRTRRLLRKIVKAVPGHDRLRENLLVQKLLAFGKRIDAAVFLYRHKKRALMWAALLSVAAHSSAVSGILFFGRALGVAEVTLMNSFVVVPVAFIVSSIPIAPAGWGIGEMAFKTFFATVGVGAAAAVTISVVFRLTQALWTLPGGLFLMVQKERPTFEEVDEEMDTAGQRLEDMAEDPDAV